MLGLLEVLLFIERWTFGHKREIAAAFPETEYQRCIVHQVRSTLKHVANKDMKKLEANWDVISPIFKFSADVRKIIYTTNNSTYRRLNSQRSVFPN